MKTAITLYCLILVLAACNSTAPTLVATAALPSTPTQQPSTAPTKTPSPSTVIVQPTHPTSTPRPTRAPTKTPTATATPFPISIKQVLLQYGVFGGDGGSNVDFYLGRDTPQLILYIDGHLLMRQKHNSWYRQATLTTLQMCTLLSRIEHSGFFEVEGEGGESTTDPIYDFGGTPQFSGDGTPEYLIQINGEQHKFVMIEPGYVPYLIQPVKTTLQIVEKYSPGPRTIPYQAKYLVLWIEKGQGNAAYMDPPPAPQSWPTQLPSLAGLLDNKNEGQAFIEGEEVAPILKVFGNRPVDIVFTEESQEYYVIARPLLPHETPEKFSVYPYEDVEFELPFKCK